MGDELHEHLVVLEGGVHHAGLLLVEDDALVPAAAHEGGAGLDGLLGLGEGGVVVHHAHRGLLGDELHVGVHALLRGVDVHDLEHAAAHGLEVVEGVDVVVGEVLPGLGRGLGVLDVPERALEGEAEHSGAVVVAVGLVGVPVDDGLGDLLGVGRGELDGTHEGGDAVAGLETGDLVDGVVAGVVVDGVSGLAYADVHEARQGDQIVGVHDLAVGGGVGLDELALGDDIGLGEGTVGLVYLGVLDAHAMLLWSLLSPAGAPRQGLADVSKGPSTRKGRRIATGPPRHRMGTLQGGGAGPCGARAPSLGRFLGWRGRQTARESSGSSAAARWASWAPRAWQRSS